VPESTQVEVLEEISQLTQSRTDGHHVSIFAYQAGPGKSFTMEGGKVDKFSLHDSLKIGFNFIWF